MNRHSRVKEEIPASSSTFPGEAPPPPTAAPQPMEGLNEVGPPPFLTKTYEIIEDTSTNHIVSWSRGDNSFVVWDTQSFSLTLLPKYFKHSNFSSFVRQLNTYGFRKVDPDKWEFAHEGFLKGQKHLLKLIRRRKTPHPNISPQAPDPCVEVGRFGLDGEVDRLQRDKQVLLLELVKLRQQQQHTKTYLQTMEHRLKKTETKQQQTMNFLARAIQNPHFFQLIHQKHMNHVKELEEAVNRKRRRHIDQPHDDEPPFVDDDIHIDRVDLLAVDDMNHLVPKEEFDESLEIGEHLDDGFWENLLNEANEEGFGVHGVEEQDDITKEEDNGDDLVHQFGFLSSSE